MTIYLNWLRPFSTAKRHTKRRRNLPFIVDDRRIVSDATIYCRTSNRKLKLDEPFKWLLFELLLSLRARVSLPRNEISIRDCERARFNCREKFVEVIVLRSPNLFEQTIILIGKFDASWPGSHRCGIFFRLPICWDWSSSRGWLN